MKPAHPFILSWLAASLGNPLFLRPAPVDAFPCTGAPDPVLTLRRGHLWTAPMVGTRCIARDRQTTRTDRLMQLTPCETARRILTMPIGKMLSDVGGAQCGGAPPCSTLSFLLGQHRHVEGDPGSDVRHSSSREDTRWPCSASHSTHGAAVRYLPYAFSSSVVVHQAVGMAVGQGIDQWGWTRHV